MTDHDRNVQELLKRCESKGIKLNQEKIDYKQSEIVYLGHIISRDGLKADPKKVDAIKMMQPPEDKAGVQRILGMVGYLQKFCPHLSQVATCKKEQSFSVGQ